MFNVMEPLPPEAVGRYPWHESEREPVAPLGQKLALALGQRVRCTAQLVPYSEDGWPQPTKDGGVTEKPVEHWRGWTRTATEPFTGIIVGHRIVYSGRYVAAGRRSSSGWGSYYEPPESDPAYRTREFSHRAWIVAYALNAKHVMVHADDLAPLP
jgi:hypothetical protein